MPKPLLTLSVLVFATSLNAMTYAADPDEHAAHTGSTAAASAAPGDPRLGMQQVEALMTRIAATGESAQRRELLAGHLAALRNQMRTIRAAAVQKPATGSQGEGAGDPHAGHGDAVSAGKSDGIDAGKDGGKCKCGMMERKMKDGGMMKKHQQVEQRLDLLERMLQQLIEHEAVERELEDDD